MDVCRLGVNDDALALIQVDLSSLAGGPGRHGRGRSLGVICGRIAGWSLHLLAGGRADRGASAGVLVAVAAVVVAAVVVAAAAAGAVNCACLHCRGCSFWQGVVS